MAYDRTDTKELTMTATATATVTTSACAMTARDFLSSTADPRWARIMWTVGALRHVVAALDGAPVVVTVDKGTGSALVGARLVGVRSSGDSNPGARLVVESVFEDGSSHRTNFLVDDIGTIVPLGESVGRRGAKWDALDLMRKESRAATEWARSRPEAATWTYGKTSTTHFVDYVDVAYESQGEGPRHAYIRVPLSAIA